MKSNHQFLACLFLTAFSYSSSSQVIPLSRRTDWSLAGYHGIKPVYQDIKNIIDYGGSGNGITLNDLALQNALLSLGDQNGVINFPAGIFLFNAPIILRSGLVLKGAGANNTTLLFNLAGTNNLINIAGSPSTTIANITTILLKEQSSLTVDDASLFKEGDHIKIYQEDAGLITDLSASESVGQIIHIESISGNTINFSNALRRNYLLSDEPKIIKLNVVTGVGIECLKIKRLDATGPLKSNIYFSYAEKCWVKGVESDSCNFAHIRIANSTNIEVTNSYFHGAFAYGANGAGYGISCEYTSGDCLIENNIFKHLRHSMLLQSGANGNVFDYNYSVQPYKSESSPNDLSGDIVLHGNYPYLNLFEGNIAQNIFVDAAHGINGPFNTFFRNRAESYGIVISAGGGDSTNMIGNEVTGSGFLKANYSMQGNANFEYGNNKNNVIIPAGTTTLSDQSYIYSSVPPSWHSSPNWPPIGIPNALNAGTIPAKERYIENMELAPCAQASAITYIFTGDGNWSLAANWSNSLMPPAVIASGSEIIIDPPPGARCVLNIPYKISPGARLTVITGKYFIVEGNLTIEQ